MIRHFNVQKEKGEIWDNIMIMTSEQPFGFLYDIILRDRPKIPSIFGQFEIRI